MCPKRKQVRAKIRPDLLLLLVELPGIEPASLPGNMPSELPVRSVSVRFSPARYLGFCSRVLTASRAVPATIEHRAAGRGDAARAGMGTCERPYALPMAVVPRPVLDAHLQS